MPVCPHPLQATTPMNHPEVFQGMGYMRKDMADYSEDQGAKCAANAIMPQSAPLTQNMNITHLKPEAAHRIASHKVGPIEKCTTKTHGAKIDGTCASCCLDMGIALDKGGEGGGTTATIPLAQSPVH